MRRVILLTSVLALCACILTPKDLEAPRAPSPPEDLAPEVLEYQAHARECRGTLEKREACLQTYEQAHRKRTNR